MVWGLEKLWASGSPTQQASAPTANSTPNSSTSTVPLVAVTAPANGSLAQTPATTTTISPAVMKRLQEEERAQEASDWFSARSRKQFTLFAAGATFMLLSARFTRRQLARRTPKRPAHFKQNSVESDISVNGPMEAVEALSIATVNVLSFSMMMTGGLLWAFDISSITDLRKKIRGGLGVDGTGRNETDVEEEFEEWLATVLDRKERKQDAMAEAARKRGIGELDEVKETWRNERGKPRNI